MVPDLIISWPRNCDYPLWRQFIAKNRWLFNNVVIVFTETNQGHDYRDFIRISLTSVPGITILESPETNGEDWRHVAVTHALNVIDTLEPADWVFFTEQDFFITSDRFWDEVLKAEKEGNEVIATLEGSLRIHPSCIFIKRSLLNKTKRYFGVVAGVCDHFGQLQKDLEEIEPKIHFIMRNYHHMVGLSHNMTLAYNGQEPNRGLHDFCKYLNMCLQSGEVMPAGFVLMANRVLRKYAENNH
jgi:hypothetical protein